MERTQKKNYQKVMYIGITAIAFLMLIMFIIYTQYKQKIETTKQQESRVPNPKEREFLDTNEGIKIDNGLTYQTIEGFGASHTWYADLLVYSEDREEVYDLLFKDAKLSILRFRNTYLYIKDLDRSKTMLKSITIYFLINIT
jgi:hypothetical protein